jgi:hypothetical protein
MPAKTPPPSAKANHVTYELQSLGWKAFQQLCSTIVGDIWGQTIQSFYDTNDGGRDGAFFGTWTTKAGTTLEGSFTVQCKFTANPNETIKASGLVDEIAKAKRLATSGLADNYLIFTNAKLTGRNEESIKSQFESIEGINCCLVYGAEQISQWIKESPRLRMLVPRVYGLGDLSQILDERAYAQGMEILSSIGDDLSKFVLTDAYRKSAEALVSHGFVLLLGEPACGKSTIAAALALGATDEWGCSTVKVRSAEDFVKHYNPHDHKQFFWVDDAFGATQLDIQELNDWNKTFPHLHAAIKKGSKVIFTSRDYIYQAAKNHLKQSALPVIRESQVVIRVEKMTESEKEQILYNHIKLGSQSGAFKSRIKPMLPRVAEHKRFSPEIARRLGHKEFTKALVMNWPSISDFIDRPMDFLKEVISTLDANSRSALALVFMRNGALDSPIKLDQEEELAIELLGGSKNNVRAALVALEGCMLSQVIQNGNYVWRFKHPTIRDAMAALVAENRELMDIYLTGTPIQQLMREVTCGEIGIKGAKVIIPENRFNLITDRIAPYVSGKKDERHSLNMFLAFRCSKIFLKLFIDSNTTYIQSLKASSYLSAISDVDIIVRLHKFDLLPESERTRHINRIYDLAVEVPDADFLRSDIRTLFSSSELEEIVHHVKINLLPDLELTVDYWKDSYDGSEDPETHFDNLRDALERFRREMADDDESVELIDASFEFIEYAIEDLRANSYSSNEPEADYRDTSTDRWSHDSRSIFDDVDM